MNGNFIDSDELGGGWEGDGGGGVGGGARGGEKAKKKRQRWSEADERVLMDIIHNSDKGALRLIIVEKITNSKMSNQDCWKRVT